MSGNVEEAIIRLLGEVKPETLEQLSELLMNRLNLSESEISEYISKLHQQGIVAFKAGFLVYPRPQNLKNYLRNNFAYWYFVVLALTLSA